jgi:hypothetical protein
MQWRLDEKPPGPNARPNMFWFCLIYFLSGLTIVIFTLLILNR